MEQDQIVHLTNSEYDAFTIQAKQAGQELEAFIHEVLDDYLAKRNKLSTQTG